MKKDVFVFFEHILDSIEKVEQYLAGKKKDEFVSSDILQDALVRRLEIIGEATRNIPESARIRYPNVPWQDISDMRNKLIHEYFIVDLDVVWNVIETDLPVLKRQILEILRAERTT
ncbi:MAG: hypothetical protein A3C90_02005 [Candidatus Magasanikbacteria bacterium RIFCSPHIGHO2_02_FULL_51_14]|uniref:DUF86 domain-containing protein n=1 Tax=Candidatus Magasanikbacteria bacterium RIFCSPHIGHO2_02_FULL_51_14 TaxID=1798683 RepID=A0A1F6MDR8_9BACT|nr:MAG: hypothetical protein A3C90_02005 [Candidatus Magasanikbacteria bacterium RIFCSPHIGHO2_02_FULL_51_14]